MGHMIGGCRGEVGLTCVLEHTPLEGVEQGEIGLTFVYTPIKVSHGWMEGVRTIQGR